MTAYDVYRIETTHLRVDASDSDDARAIAADILAAAKECGEAAGHVSERMEVIRR
jgi:hypothetical protein